MSLISGLAAAVIIGAIAIRLWEAHLPTDVLQEEGLLIGAGIVYGVIALAISGDKRVLAASAPRAGRVVNVDTGSAAVIGETPLTDGCGLTGIAQSEFALSSGLGVVQTEAPDHTHLRTASFPGRSFDNHLRLVR